MLLKHKATTAANNGGGEPAMTSPKSSALKNNSAANSNGSAASNNSPNILTNINGGGNDIASIATAAALAKAKSVMKAGGSQAEAAEAAKEVARNILKESQQQQQQQNGGSTGTSSNGGSTGISSNGGTSGAQQSAKTKSWPMKPSVLGKKHRAGLPPLGSSARGEGDDGGSGGSGSGGGGVTGMLNKLRSKKKKKTKSSSKQLGDGGSDGNEVDETPQGRDDVESSHNDKTHHKSKKRSTKRRSGRKTNRNKGRNGQGKAKRGVVAAKREDEQEREEAEGGGGDERRETVTPNHHNGVAGMFGFGRAAAGRASRNTTNGATGREGPALRGNNHHPSNSGSCNSEETSTNNPGTSASYSTYDDYSRDDEDDEEDSRYDSRDGGNEEVDEGERYLEWNRNKMSAIYIEEQNEDNVSMLASKEDTYTTFGHAQRAADVAGHGSGRGGRGGAVGAGNARGDMRGGIRGGVTSEDDYEIEDLIGLNLFGSGGMMDAIDEVIFPVDTAPQAVNGDRAKEGDNEKKFTSTKNGGSNTIKNSPKKQAPNHKNRGGNNEALEADEGTGCSFWKMCTGETICAAPSSCSATDDTDSFIHNKEWSGVVRGGGGTNSIQSDILPSTSANNDDTVGQHSTYEDGTANNTKSVSWADSFNGEDVLNTSNHNRHSTNNYQGSSHLNSHDSSLVKATARGAVNGTENNSLTMTNQGGAKDATTTSTSHKEGGGDVLGHASFITKDNSSLRVGGDSNMNMMVANNRGGSGNAVPANATSAADKPVSSKVRDIIKNISIGAWSTAASCSVVDATKAANQCYFPPGGREADVEVYEGDDDEHQRNGITNGPAHHGRVEYDTADQNWRDMVSDTVLEMNNPNPAGSYHNYQQGGQQQQQQQQPTQTQYTSPQIYSPTSPQGHHYQPQKEQIFPESYYHVGTMPWQQGTHREPVNLPSNNDNDTSDGVMMQQEEHYYQSQQQQQQQAATFPVVMEPASNCVPRINSNLSEETIDERRDRYAGCSQEQEQLALREQQVVGGMVGRGGNNLVGLQGGQQQKSSSSSSSRALRQLLDGDELDQVLTTGREQQNLNEVQPYMQQRLQHQQLGFDSGHQMHSQPYNTGVSNRQTIPLGARSALSSPNTTPHQNEYEQRRRYPQVYQRVDPNPSSVGYYAQSSTQPSPSPGPMESPPPTAPGGYQTFAA